MEQGALLTAMFGCEEGEPTGDASAGEGRKWGSDACIDVSVVGCGRDMGAWKENRKNTDFSALFQVHEVRVAFVLGGGVYVVFAGCKK